MGFNLELIVSRLRTLYAQVTTNNTCPFCITAAAGTELAGASYLILPSLSSETKELYDQWAFFTHAILLDQALAHCPKFLTAASNAEFDPCLSSNVADRSSKPAKDRRLGRPLPTPTT